MKLLLSTSAATALALGAAAGEPGHAADAPPVEIAAHAFLDYDRVTVDGEEIVNGTELRLFRLDLNGAYEGYKFVGVVDFGQSDVNIKDLFAEFGDQTAFRLGSFKLPNGLEMVSSVYSTLFMERAAIAKVNGFGRRLGVGAFGSVGRLGLQGGLFSTDINAQGDEEGWAAAGRLTFSDTLGAEEGRVLHLAASARYREAGSGDDPLGYGHRPVANMAPRTIDTDDIAASDVFVGVEGALVLGGLSFQSEYGLTSAECAVGICTDDPEFASGYLDAAYMWGGTRVYDARSGAFKRDRVFSPAGQGGWGALALAVRLDTADLTDGGVAGGRQDTAMIGATYFRDSYVRLMVNYAHSEFEGSPVYGDDSARSLMARAQIELH